MRTTPEHEPIVAVVGTAQYGGSLDRLPTFALRPPDTIDPRWFNQVRYGRHDAVVDGGAITLFGTKLRFPSVEHPADGTAVVVWLDRDFVCARKHDLDETALRAKEFQAATEAAGRSARDVGRADAAYSNAMIALPVAWEPGIKDVLSGLTEYSTGDGRRSNTVAHIKLLATLQAGRLSRPAGSFLCTSSSGTNGKQWSSTDGTKFTSSGEAFASKVNCQSCLRAAVRFVRANEPTNPTATAALKQMGDGILKFLDAQRRRFQLSPHQDGARVIAETEHFVRDLRSPGFIGVPLRVAAIAFIEGKETRAVLESRVADYLRDRQRLIVLREASHTASKGLSLGR